MKYVKQWLIPALTCLIAAGAVVLPPRVSQIRDARQFGQIHTEALATESWPAGEGVTLLDRLAFYAGQYAPEHPILSFRDNTYFEDSKAADQALAAQELLIKAEIVPDWVFREEPFDDAEASRILLWDPEEERAREPSVYWNVEWACYSNKLHQMSVSLILDAETGLPIHLYIGDTNLSQWLLYDMEALRALAERFFTLLGLEVQEVDPGGAMFDPSLNLSYTVAGSPVRFHVSRAPTDLTIVPELDGRGVGTNAFDG